MSRLLPVLLLFTLWSAWPPLQRLNSGCEWTNDPPRPLNSQTSADARHLRNDALIAEELAIRYADTTRGRRSGHFAGAGEYVRTRERCLASLTTAAAGSHDVRPEVVRAQIGQRQLDFDLAVALSFIALYAAICRALARRLADRFRRDEATLAVAATAFASAMASAGGLMIFALWTTSWEMLRVADMHMSYRVGRSPWSQHQLLLFTVGAGLFLATALLSRVNPGDADAV